MPLTCDAFAENTVRDTQQTADCKQTTTGLEEYGVLDNQFLLLVLDSLERLGIGPTLAAIAMCDAEAALKNANCAVDLITSPGNIDEQKLKALILLKLNEELCP